MKNISISKPIEEKIDWAINCYQALKEQFLEDKTAVSLLEKLKSAISASHEAMQKTGIVDLCRKCEQDEGGSCCGAGLENKYDGRLLLINLLLGVQLPKVRNDPKSCFFLSQTGCMLQARHVICINYICKKIADQVPLQNMRVLREKEGTEIDLVFLLHEHLTNTLRNI